MSECGYRGSYASRRRGIIRQLGIAVMCILALGCGASIAADCGDQSQTSTLDDRAAQPAPAAGTSQAKEPDDPSVKSSRSMPAIPSMRYTKNAATTPDQSL
jgi:hypothetical protein